MLNTCFCIYKLIYTFLDSTVYLHSKTYYAFFGGKCTLWYHIFATLLTSLCKLILLICLGEWVMFCLWMKKNDSFQSILVYFAFFLSGCFYQFCTSNFRPVFDLLYFHISFSTRFWQFVKKLDDLSSAFRWSYDISSTVYYSSPGHWNLSQVHPPYTHYYPNILLYESQEKAFGLPIFVKFELLKSKWYFAIDLSLQLCLLAVM